MIHKFRLIGLTLIFTFTSFAVFSQDFDLIDSFLDVGDLDAAKTTLLSWLGQNPDRTNEAKVYRYLAQTELRIGDERERSEGLTGDALLAIFEQGLDYIDQSIELNPRDGQAFFWKAALIGRWGQTKGVLDSLNKASEMQENLIMAIELDPDFSPSYMVMGQLYFALPGWRISFGDRERAISFYRKALATPSEDPSYQVDVRVLLAETLADRNWSVEWRNNEQNRKREEFGNFNNSWERFSFFEGTIRLARISDRVEAQRLLDQASQLYERIPPEKRNPNTPEEIQAVQERLN
jgi:tetratricopeptide (TPR) repeat protein